MNNATAARNADLWRVTEEDWDLALGVNLKGYFAMIREAAPHLCGQGSGVIVNTSSGSGFGHPSAIAYTSAKEGVVGLTRTVARELGRFGVRCNAIRPLALGVSTKEYGERTSKWATLMSITMAPRGAHSRSTWRRPRRTHRRRSHRWWCGSAPTRRGRQRADVPRRGRHRARASASRNANGRSLNAGGWTLDALDAVAPTHLVEDLTNDYLLEDHPELQVFEP